MWRHISKIVKVAGSKKKCAKQWRGNHTNAKHWIYPDPARCLNAVAVNLMRVLFCLEPVTWATSENDVSTLELYVVQMFPTDWQAETDILCMISPDSFSID